MTDDPTANAGTEGARRLLTESERFLDDLLAGFQAIAREEARGLSGPETDAARAEVALASVRTTILKEVRRHEARVFDSEDRAAAAPIDLDDIRSQIGRRLDRIRDAR